MGTLSNVRKTTIKAIIFTQSQIDTNCAENPVSQSKLQTNKM